MSTRLTAKLAGIVAAVVIIIGHDAADAASITMTPPAPPLILDGMSISEGVFSITGGDQYLADGTKSPITLLQPTFDAMIDPPGPTSAPLFSFSDNAQALQILGNFNATVPDIPAAEFQITVGAPPNTTPLVRDPSLILLDDLFTFFLEPNTADMLHQVTDLAATTALADNNDSFFDTLIPMGVFQNDPGGNRIQLGDWFFPTPGMSTSTAISHGTARVVPEPTTLALMALGLAGLGFARRRRMSA